MSIKYFWAWHNLFQCFMGVSGHRLTEMCVFVVKATCLIRPSLLSSSSLLVIWQFNNFFKIKLKSLLLRLSMETINEAFQSTTEKQILSFYWVFDFTKCFSRNLWNNSIQWRRTQSTLRWRKRYFWYRFWS